MVNQFGSFPKHYTLDLNASVQKFTLAANVDAVVLDSTGLVNIWADEVTVQAANGNAANLFVAYKTGGAPSNIDITNAMLDLSPGQAATIPRSNAAKQRGDQVNLRDLYAKGSGTDYLHIIVPKRDEVTIT